MGRVLHARSREDVPNRVFLADMQLAGPKALFAVVCFSDLRARHLGFRVLGFKV